MWKKKSICIGLIAMLFLCGCRSSVDTNKKNPTDSESTGGQTQQENKMEDIVIEAEDANLLGGTIIAKNRDDYNGSGYVTNFTKEEDGVAFEITVKKDGVYDLIFRANSSGAYKEMYVCVDNGQKGSICIESDGFSDYRFQKVWMDKGTHTVALKNSWGYVDLDSLTVRSASLMAENTYLEVSKELCNPNATKEAKNLYQYLLSIYGRKTLAGQHVNSNTMTDRDILAIQKSTGETPALMEVDFMDISGSRIEKDGSGYDYSKVADYAIAFAKKGGIIAASWHWNAPTKYLYDTDEQPWYKGFNAEASSIDLEGIMYGQNEEGYSLLLEDIDRVAEVLKELQDAQVPVLFRPLHEANGGWFWWGEAGAVPYKELYRMLYDRLVNYHKLNNLIWVWNADEAEWYPGDNCVDIASVDVYAADYEYSTQVNSFIDVYQACGRTKMVALAECGVLIDPDQMKRENVHWLYSSAWGEYIAGDGMLIELSNEHTEEEMLKKFYSSEDIVTLDELPDWKNGIFE